MSARNKTAGEVYAELQASPEYRRRMEMLNHHRQAELEEVRHAQAPVIAELGTIGFTVSSLDELRRSGVRYDAAIPVLLKWLTRTSHPGIKESLVRTLSVPFAPATVAPLLIAEFRKAKDQDGLKWAIANALEIVADDAAFEELAALAGDVSHGRTREMLAVALGNMSSPRAVDVLMTLLNDEEVAGHAVMGLGKLKPLKARAAIEPFVQHRKPWIRNAAKKALKKIDRG